MSDESKSSTDDNDNNFTNDNKNKHKASDHEDSTITAEERRARNRKSAYQSRLRKRLLIEELQGKASALTKELESLQEENRALVHQMDVAATENTRLLLINQQESFLARQQQQQQQNIINGNVQGNGQQQHHAAAGMAQLNGLGLGLAGMGAPAGGWSGLAAQMHMMGGGPLGAMNGFHQQLAGLAAIQQQLGQSNNLQGLLAAQANLAANGSDYQGGEGEVGLTNGGRPNTNRVSQI